MTTILVVEDEPSIREVEVAYLARAGYATLEVADGQAAIDAFREYKPGLVLLDLSLPGRSGFEVCQSIRESSTVPILIVTARRDDQDEVRGLALGADDYIKKQYRLDKACAGPSGDTGCATDQFARGACAWLLSPPPPPPSSG